MLFSIMWGRIQEQTTNFEHLVHETWPQTSGRVVFKFYKKQTKTKNLKTCRDVMISYVEVVIKNWEGFAQVVTYDACKPKNLRRTRQRVNGGCRPLTVAALCRVLWFAECPTLGKPGLCRVLLFVECSLCRVPVVCRVLSLWHSANNLFAECLIKSTRQSLGHSIKKPSPVVKCWLLTCRF